VNGSPASAAEPGSGPAADRKVCTDVRVDDVLTAPGAGMTVVQTITLDETCTPHAGPISLVRSAPSTVEGTGGDRRLRVWSQMYDCCGILMNALYATHQWSTVGGQVDRVHTDTRTDWNREPWGGGWNLAALSETGGCAEPCPSARLAEHAEFDYRGIFDITGTWYHNTHDMTAIVSGDGTATCQLSLTARHWFIGWTWIRGCGQTASVPPIHR
jgi:hypothetical protein